MDAVRIQEEPLDLTQLLSLPVAETTGSVNLYLGTVRADDAGTTVTSLQVEAFSSMAAKELQKLRQATMERFGLRELAVVHRVGDVAAGQPIVGVVIHAGHRKETFAAIEFFMAELKRLVPIWKQEQGPAGARWIEGEHAKESIS